MDIQSIKTIMFWCYCHIRNLAVWETPQIAKSQIRLSDWTEHVWEFCWRCREMTKSNLFIGQITCISVLFQNYAKALGDTGMNKPRPYLSEMATHSGTLAWEIHWTEEHGALQSMGLQRVRCGWVCIHCPWEISLGGDRTAWVTVGVEGRCQVKAKELPGMGNQCLWHPGFHTAAPFLDLPMWVGLLGLSTVNFCWMIAVGDL